VDPLAGLGKAALLLGLILFTFAAVRAASVLDKMTLSGAAIAFAAGALLGTLFVMVELLTHGIVTRTVVSWLPFLASQKHFDISNGVITEIHLSKLDQNVNVAKFHLWPGLLALIGLASTRRAMATMVFFAVIATVIAISKHDSSQVALVVSSVVVILAWKWRTLVIRALAVFWFAAFVLVIPANFAAYDNGLHFAEWLPKSARARIILWEYTSEQTLERPLLGAGVDSTPLLTNQQKATFARERPKGFVYPRTMGHHAHSIFLQTWSELGAIGAMLLAVAGAAVALSILLLPAVTQPFAAGAFAAFAVVGAFAWGMWQSWFMCAAALLAMYLRAASGGVASQAEPNSTP
jgi:O-antigen ligase